MKVLLIAAQPFRPSENSRSVMTCFSAFDPQEVVQVFSDARTPIKGLASQYFQITDKRLLKRRFKKEPDVIFHRETLSETEAEAVNLRPKLFRKRGGFYRLLRAVIWKKKYWDTQKLESFVEDFSPDLVYVCWGPDLWQMDLAIHFATERKLPLVVSIMDDCFANFGKRRSLWDKKYERLFRETFSKLLSLNPCGVYISEKIRDKYHSEFCLDGIVVPVASSWAVRQPDVSSFLRGPFTYMGNLESGRDEALYAFAQALAKADKKEKVLVYSKDCEKAKKRLPSPNIEWMAPLPYDQLPEIEAKAGVLISCEGFSQENIDKARYSLSTKVGDCLRSGKVLLSLGPVGAGSVDYLKEKDAALFCTSLDAMDQFIEGMYANTEEELLALVQRELQAGMEFDLKTNAEKVRDYLLGLVRKSGD